MTSHTAWRLPRQTVGYFLGFFALGTAIASLGPMLPSLASRLGQSPETLGYFFSARSMGYLIGALFGGRLYDRFPGHRVLVGMLALLVLSVGLPGSLDSTPLVVAAIFFSGIALGGLDVGSNTLLAWTHGARVGPYINLMFFFGGLGSALVPLAVTRLLPLGGLPAASWGVALVAVPALVWLFFAPSPAISRMDAKELVAPPGLGLLATFGILFFIFVGLEVSFGGWIFTYIIALQPGNAALASLINSAFYQAVTVGRLLAVPAASRFAPRTLVLVNITGVLASLVVLSTWRTPAGIWVGALGLGLSLASMFPSVFALANQRMRVTGRSAGILWAFGSSGGILLPWITGEAMSGIAPTVLAPVLLGMVVLGLVGFAGLWKLNKHG